jgi:hypothetical protein
MQSNICTNDDHWIVPPGMYLYFPAAIHSAWNLCRWSSAGFLIHMSSSCNLFFSLSSILYILNQVSKKVSSWNRFRRAPEHFFQTVFTQSSIKLLSIQPFSCVQTSSQNGKLNFQLKSFIGEDSSHPQHPPASLHTIKTLSITMCINLRFSLQISAPHVLMITVDDSFSWTVVILGMSKNTGVWSTRPISLKKYSICCSFLITEHWNS